MSIWTELLFLHGHIATPRGLALVAPVAREPASPPPAAAPAAPPSARHALRVVGQLK